MKCEEVKKLLESYHDEDADLLQKINIKNHIAGCPSCFSDSCRLEDLSLLLQKSSIPEPSALLKEGLTTAFRLHHKQSPKTWRQRLFAGSISIPKPIFAVSALAVITLMTAFVSAGLMERNSGNSSNATNAEAVSPSIAIPSSNSPDAEVRTKFIEVPVISRQVVTKIVYVERQNKEAEGAPNNFAFFRRREFNRERRKNTLGGKPNATDLMMNGGVAGNGYFTRTDLTGFEPSSEMKPRIIREGKINEK